MTRNSIAVLTCQCGASTPFEHVAAVDSGYQPHTYAGATEPGDGSRLDSRAVLASRLDRRLDRMAAAHDRARR